MNQDTIDGGDNLMKYNFMEDFDAGNGIGKVNILLSNLENGKLTTTPIKGTWSDDCKEITFEEGKYLFAYALIGGQYAEFFRVTNIKLTRAK